MLKVFFLSFLLFCLKVSFGQNKTASVQNDRDLCIKTEINNIQGCGNKNDITVIITNKCKETFDGMVAIEKVDGKWSIHYFNELKPGESQKGFWACNTTGQIKIYRASLGIAHLQDYPSQKELQEKFGTRKSQYEKN